MSRRTARPRAEERGRRDGRRYVAFAKPVQKRGTIENAAPSRRSRPAITRPLVLGSSSLQPPARVPRAKYRTPPASVARRRPRHQTASQGGRQRVLRLASFPQECHGGVDVRFLAARQSRPCFFPLL